MPDGGFGVQQEVESDQDVGMATASGGRHRRDAVRAAAGPLRPGFVTVWFEGEEASAAKMAERLVFTLEVWVASMAGDPIEWEAGS